MVERLSDLGVRSGDGRTNVKVTCPQCGKPGERHHFRDKSLSVNVEDGRFKCHYCGFKGRVSEFGGITDWRPKVFSRPAPRPVTPAKFSPRALEFFALRKINMVSVEKFGVYEQDGALKFPYIRDGDLVNVKTRYPGKKFSMEADCELIFFGLNLLDLSLGEVTIVEGELDALALDTAGVPNVISVPNGAQTGEMSWLASAQLVFDAVDTVVLGVDADGPGQLLEAELARRVGRGLCQRIQWPDGCKDANDVLVKYGDAKLWAIHAGAEDYPVEGAHWLHEFTEDAIQLRRTQQQRGAPTGWSCIDSLYTVAPGELTIITGVPGSGKSEWLDALMVNLAENSGYSFAIYSPENAPGEQHFVKLAQKYLGMPYWPGPSLEMTDDHLRQFGKWAGDKFVWLDPESPTIDTLIGLARGFVFRRGVNGLVIDPWNRLNHTRVDGVQMTEHVKHVLGELSSFAHRNSVHVWLVAHPKKMDREDGKVPVPTPYDIADSAHFFNMADNCIAINRDKESPTSPTEIRVQKIRFQRVGQLGSAFLHYDRVTGKYREVR